MEGLLAAGGLIATLPIEGIGGIAMDGSAIASAITSFEAASNIVRSLVSMNLNAKTLAEVNALQRTIFEANRDALAAQADYRAALTRIAELEEVVARLERPSRDSKEYELRQVGAGAFVYALKPNARISAPAHWLCPNCFSNGHKSILQHDRDFSIGGDYYACPRCDRGVTADAGLSPRSPAT